MNQVMTWMSQICGMLVCLFVGALGLAIVIKVFTNNINLSNLINDGKYGASMSRFQFLIFTFVIALAFFKLVEVNGNFPEVPTGVLMLLGISASTYAVGKGISSGDSGSDGDGNAGSGAGRPGSGGTDGAGDGKVG
jgi:hypothetical protein